MDSLRKNIDDIRMKSVRHGFPGQRMTVVPRPLIDAALAHPLLGGLVPTDAGFFPEARYHTIRRSRGLPGAIVILCEEGRGWLELAGDRITVERGDVVFIAPGEAHAYGADASSPWTIQWVHCEGAEVAAWFAWHGVEAPGGVFRVAGEAFGQAGFSGVYEAIEAGFDLRSLLAAAGALRCVLAGLRRGGAMVDRAVTSREAVEGVERWMREHVGREVCLADLARRAGLSVAHFTALFRERYGFPPMDYVLRLRIRRAARLLASTDWPVKHIATEVGFDDPLYLSRQFRKHMGQSPRAFRQIRTIAR